MQLADSADEFLFTLTADTTIVATAVLRARDVHAARQARVSGRRFLEFLPPTHRAAVQALFDAVRASGRPISQTIRFDGSDERFELQLSLLDGPPGQAGFACLLRNHAALPPPEVDRFDQALSHARVAWFERDLRTDIGTGSPSLAQIYGLENPKGPWHFDEIKARVVSEDRGAHSAEIARGLRRPVEDVEARTLNYRIRRPDGTLRYLEVRYRNLFDENRPRAYGLIFDVTEAKAFEQQLLESQHWLNLALRAAGITLWSQDLRSGLVRTSANFGGFTAPDDARTQWSRDEFVAAFDANGRDAFLAALSAWERGDLTPRPRVTVTDAQGNQRWLEAAGSLEYDEDGKPARLLGVAIDVTANVEQARARAASDERLARITNLVPGVVYQFRRDPAGHYSMPYANCGIVHLFGLRPETVRDDASALVGLVHPEDRAGLVSDIERSAHTLTRWQHECRFQLPGRGLRWMHGVATPQREDDGSVLWHGHIVDVTERYEAQQLLEASRQRLSLAMSAARMTSWHWDLTRDVITASKELRKFLDIPASQVTADTLFSRVHPDDVDALRARFVVATQAKDDESFTLDYRFRMPDGEYRWVELRARGVRSAEGKVVAFDGVSLDITERRRAEAERERLQRQLSQAQRMESIGLLTGGIAHDFNNILASVLGYSGLALHRFGDSNPPKLKDYLSEVIKAGERARDLVMQMLAFSRGETSEVAAVEVAPLIEQMMKMLRPILPSSIEIEVRVEADLPCIDVNAVQLQQVLLNLCINARDAMNAAGAILIAAGRQQFAPTHCASCHKPFSGDHVVLSVTDTGMGIPEETRVRVFDPFFTTKAEQKGTGMGLATVHGIVHRHGGHIGLVSQTGKGSTFSIAMPVATAHAMSGDGAEKLRAKPIEAVRPARILVVDDEPSIAHVTAETLEIAGFQVELETDPQRAAARLRDTAQPFDLLITDQTMPRMTGHELALAAMAAQPDLPVLLVTGHSALIDERQALALGIRGYLRKPVPRDMLLAAVNGALRELEVVGAPQR